MNEVALKCTTAWGGGGDTDLPAVWSHPDSCWNQSEEVETVVMKTNYHGR